MNKNALTPAEKKYQLIDPDTWEVVGEITQKELAKRFGWNKCHTAAKIGRLLIADEEGVKL